MSATGHQVLSFVTSGEMTNVTSDELTKNAAPVTRFSLALGEITEVKDIGCVAEFVMRVFAANGLRSRLPRWRRPDYHQLSVVAAHTAALE